MLISSPITNQPVGKTFSIAIIALGAGALLQLLLIGWAFAHRAQNGLPPVGLASVPPAANDHPLVAHATVPSVPGQKSLDFGTDPFSEPPQTQRTDASASTVPPKPTPISLKVESAEPANRFEELLLQGKQLRDRGDMSTAITKFREAGAIDARNPAAIAELAATYEKMGLADKAAEQWRKVLGGGAAAGGVYYSLAEAKLKAAQEHIQRDLDPKQTPETTEPVDTAAPVEGIAAGSFLGLLPITSEEQRDDNAAKRFALHIPIKARPKARVEVRDLVIHVLFYDIVDGQNVVQTSANVNSRWATPPADWTDTDTEELAVEYQLPKPEARASKRENRKYFGYIVRIYYKQQLQAATADPPRLAQQYPPPPTLPKENEK